jgi:subtilisin family serine protease
LLAKFGAALLVALLAVASISAPAQAQISEPAYNAINLNSLWSQGIQGQGMTIALIDQGVNLQHEYFRDQVIDGICVYQPQNSYRCPDGSKLQTGIAAASQRIENGALVESEDHGNMVAGIVAGKPNSIAPGGVAPLAKILMANTDMKPSSVVTALNYILANREKHNIVAVSMSFGILGLVSRQDLLNCNTNSVYTEVRKALKRLRDVGVIPFAAAGNGYYLNSAESWAPTCLDEAVSVASVDRTGSVALYNTMSTKVELLAPDYAISASTYGYGVSSGTSAAAPMAAASYALLRQLYPYLSAEQVLAAMKTAGKKVDDVILKAIPMVDVAATKSLLASSQAGNPSQDTTKKITIGTFNGYIAIYTKGYEGQRLTAKVAGKWLKVDPIELVPGKSYSLVKRNTGAGFLVNVEVFIDGVSLQSATTRTK